jgi:hypothetical protein
VISRAISANPHDRAMTTGKSAAARHSLAP